MTSEGRSRIRWRGCAAILLFFSSVPCWYVARDGHHSGLIVLESAFLAASVVMQCFDDYYENALQRLIGFGSYVFYGLALIDSFAGVYRVHKLEPPPSTGFGYFYFSVITWTSVGYGDIVPTPA